MIKTMPIHLSGTDPARSTFAKLSKGTTNPGEIIVPTDEAARRFEIFKRDFEDEARKVRELQVGARALDARIHEQRVRLEAGLPEQHVCPNCWVRHGQIRLIVAGRTDEPSKFNRWECNAGCGYFFDVPAA